MLLHHLNSREEPRSREAMCYDTLDVDVLVSGRAPHLNQNEPAGSICPMLGITGQNKIGHTRELGYLHWRIKFDTNNTLLPLDEKSCMKW